MIGHSNRLSSLLHEGRAFRRGRLISAVAIGVVAWGGEIVDTPGPAKIVPQAANPVVLESHSTPIASVVARSASVGTSILKPVSPDPSAPAIASLIARGESLARAGDFAAARLLLRRAAVSQNSVALLALAATYDPNVLEQVGSYGTAADALEARRLYEKAAEYGSPEATRRLELLLAREPPLPTKARNSGGA